MVSKTTRTTATRKVGRPPVKSKKKKTSRSKAKTSTQAQKSSPLIRARGIWSGAISFGLINIPVRLVTAREQPDLHFTMLDPKNLSPVGYKYYNKKTGKEIRRGETVKAYEYRKGEYVILTDTDFKKANPKATQTIDIQAFCELHEIDPVYFQRAYYILPNKGGDKPYTLLREALESTTKVAIALLVLHTKQHLAALIPRGDFLLLELLHFAEDVKDLKELEELQIDRERVKPQEVQMAEKLIQDMSEDWQPQKFADSYRKDILKMVQAKVKAGKSTEIAEDFEAPDFTVSVADADLLPLLQKSLKKNRSKKTSRKNLH